MSYIFRLAARSAAAWEKMEKDAEEEVAVTARSAFAAAAGAEAPDGRSAESAEAGSDAAALRLKAGLDEADAAAVTKSEDAVGEGPTGAGDGGAETAARLLALVSNAASSARYTVSAYAAGAERTYETPARLAPGAGELSKIFERDARRCGDAFTLFE